jgi:Na+/melibiose symporter-like transporter
MPSGFLTGNTNFMKLWIGETVSLTGSAITMLALPVTALTLLRATPLEMGLLLACSAGSSTLMGFFAGVFADRFSRQGLLFWSNIGRMLIIASIPVVYLFGTLSLSLLFIVAFLTGLLDSIFGAAYQSFLPDLVVKEALVAANSRFEGSRVLATLLGSLLSGLLIVALTAPVALFIDAGSFLFSGICILLIRYRGQIAANSEHEGIWKEIIIGLRFVFTQPLLRIILILSMLFNLFAPMLNGQFVLYVTQTLGLSPALFGLGGALAGGGGVLMAILAPRIITRLGMGRAGVIATFLIAAGWSLVPLANGTLVTLVLILLGGVIIGTMGDVLFNISISSLRQSITPQILQGRVGASISVVVRGLQPVGAIIGGLLAEMFGVRSAFFIFAGGFIFTFLVASFSSLGRTSPIFPPTIQKNSTIGAG